MKNLTKCLFALSIAAGCAVVPASAEMKTYEGQVVTGANRYLGQPVQDYGPPLNTFGFYNMGVYNPHGNEPIMIDENTPEDALLVSAVDPIFLNAAGLPLSLIKEKLNNIPLAEIGINVGLDGDTRVTLPSVMDVDPTQPSQALPLEQVTLKDWLSANGTARFYCTDKINAVYIKVKSLLPNRLYTVWGLYETAEGKFKAATLGGTPNAIATDKKGNGTFKRELNFCPGDTTELGARLIAMDIIYHSDHQVYAGVPGLALNSMITGTNTHSHLWFTISGEKLLDE